MFGGGSSEESVVAVAPVTRRDALFGLIWPCTRHHPRIFSVGRSHKLQCCNKHDINISRMRRTVRVKLEQHEDLVLLSRGRNRQN